MPSVILRAVIVLSLMARAPKNTRCDGACQYRGTVRAASWRGDGLSSGGQFCALLPCILRCTLGWATHKRTNFPADLVEADPIQSRGQRSPPGPMQPEASTMDDKTKTKKAGTLTIGNQNYSFPIYDGTVGPSVINIAKLYNDAGIFTY